jgi:hypothetical protein
VSASISGETVRKGQIIVALEYVIGDAVGGRELGAVDCRELTQVALRGGTLAIVISVREEVAELIGIAHVAAEQGAERIAAKAVLVRSLEQSVQLLAGIGPRRGRRIFLGQCILDGGRGRLHVGRIRRRAGGQASRRGKEGEFQGHGWVLGLELCCGSKTGQEAGQAKIRPSKEAQLTRFRGRAPSHNRPFPAPGHRPAGRRRRR